MQMSNHCSQIMMLRSKLKTKLDPMRYEHSLSVSFTCMNLAMRYGYDIDKAELAGLMHDCGKRFTDEIILKKCISHKILVTDAEQKALPVLHAKYGAWLAENKYGIEDPEIIAPLPVIQQVRQICLFWIRSYILLIILSQGDTKQIICLR